MNKIETLAKKAIDLICENADLFINKKQLI